jgi:hypothetical protein
MSKKEKPEHENVLRNKGSRKFPLTIKLAVEPEKNFMGNFLFV